MYSYPSPLGEPVGNLRKHCTRFLYLHHTVPPAQIYSELAEYCQTQDCDLDNYGSGEFLDTFETQVADLLGKKAAVFMPSGVMAQLIALRIWSEHRGLPQVAFHPSSHLEINEHRAYAHLHGLKAQLIGAPQSVITAADVLNFPMDFAALLVELPMRWLGGLLPDWEALEDLKGACKEQGIRLHLDGARLWETQPWFGLSYAEICEGFDSVYVSFYKTLGGLSGALLAGSEDFIAEARVWQRRHGGNLYQLHPYVVSAKLNLEKRLHRISAYVAKSRELARGLSEIDGLCVKPLEPRVNMMHLYLRASASKLAAARDLIAREQGVWVCNRFYPSDHPEWSFCEVFTGDNLLDMDTEEVIHLFSKLLTLATQTQVGTFT